MSRSLLSDSGKGYERSERICSQNLDRLPVRVTYIPVDRASD